jgi:hypothetical protein
MGDLDPVRELPYGPAAVVPAASKAGQMTASDHAQQRPQRFPLPERERPQMASSHSPTGTNTTLAPFPFSFKRGGMISNNGPLSHSQDV